MGGSDRASEQRLNSRINLRGNQTNCLGDSARYLFPGFLALSDLSDPGNLAEKRGRGVGLFLAIRPRAAASPGG